MRGTGGVNRGKRGGPIRRALALAGTTAVFAGLVGGGSAVAAPWGFEQVTPVNKGGGAISYVDTFRTSPDGNTFLYTTNSEFAELPAEGQPAYMRYIGRRGPDAWSNRSLDPPYDAGAGSGVALNIMGVTRTSYGLDHAIMGSTIAKTPGAIEGGGNVYLRDTQTGEYTLLAASENRILSLLFTTNYGAANSQWVAPDGSAAIFSSPVALVPGAPENAANPEDLVKGGAAYGWTAENGLEALTVLPASEGGTIVPLGSWGAGNETGPRESTPRHNGLDHFYFSPVIDYNIRGVYERTGGVTYPVSYSRVTGDQSDVKPAVVLSTSDNGEYMLFQTKEDTPLTSDTVIPEGEAGGPVSYLYRYTQADKSIEYVGTVAGYSGAFQMTQDGQTVGFQSNLKLTEDAIDLEPNLYLWHDGDLQLIATPEATSSGAQTPTGMRVLSENGRYLVFNDDSIRLTEQFDQERMSPNCPAFFSTEPGPCDQVFLFDAEAPAGEQLHCVSCRPDGAAPNGDSGDPLTGNSAFARMDEHQMQTVANDGTAFFTTKDGLLPEDDNELEDAYAYKDGELRLLSRAANGMASRFLDATYDGKTVFIATNDPIVGSDNDSAYDIYMTREGAGYPFNPVVPVPPCDGLEACRGASPAPPANAPSGSAFFEGRGNPSTKPGVVKLARATTSGPVATLRVKVSGKGRLTAGGKGLKKAAKATGKAGVYKLQLRLNAKAKKALNRKGKLRKKVRVTFTPTEGRASSLTRTLTFNTTANGKGN